MRPVVVSVAVHVAILFALLAHRDPPRRPAQLATLESRPPADDAVVDVLLDVTSDVGDQAGGGSPATAAPHVGSHRSASAASAAPAGSAWQQVTVRVEGTTGVGTGGIGTGIGGGIGSGIGIGAGIGDVVRIADDVPPPPPPAKISKARPAKLVYPSRNRDVEDEADLFVARVTVDSDGDVVGARMVRTRPGARGDQAANAIWEFRYLPALDDDGRPIASTFEQPFQIAR